MTSSLDLLPPLADEELEMCKKAFQMFDKDGSGTIDVKELKTAMSALGQSPSDEEIFVMISQVDADGSGEIEFREFLTAIRINKGLTEKHSSEQDTIDAFAALGGNADKSGKIMVQRLLGILNDFDLKVDIQGLGVESNADGEAAQELDYEGFKTLLA